jgi:hypothetical protein
MIDNTGERFAFSYERDAAASYLVVRTGVDEKILHYQVQMAAYNRIEHVLPFALRRKDNEIAFYYNITSRLSLAQFLKMKSMKLDAFAAVLSDIAAVLLGCGSYLLSDRNFLIDENYIFIDPQTVCVYLVYIPVDMDDDINDRLKGFIIRLIMNSVDTGGEKSARYLQRILNFVKSETFNVIDFKKLLDGLIDGSDQVSRLNSVPEIPDVQTIPSLNGDKKVIEDEKKYGSISAGMRLPAVIAVLQLSATAAVMTGYILLKGKDPVSFGALTLIAAALDIAVVKKLLKTRKLSSNRKEIALPSVPGSCNAKGIVSPESGTVKGQPGMKADLREEVWKPEAPGENEAADEIENSRRSFNETMVLTMENREFPCLQNVKDILQDEIPITKSSFILGRIREQVDYTFDNFAIGKVHAEIITRDGAYHIKDLNSRNGTFINHVRIDSNLEYEIKNNDRVAFANSEYIFLTPN